jgi:hypothetical protein
VPTAALQSVVVKVVIILKDMADVLNAHGDILFQVVTAQHIQSSIVKNVAGVSNVSVNAKRVSEKLVPNSNGSNRKLVRALQNKPLSPLQVVLNVQVDSQSSSGTNHTADIANWIGSSFATANDRSQYISELQQADNSVFSSVTSVEVLVDGYTPPATPSSNSSKSGLVGIIIGVVVGAVVLLLLLILGCICYRRMSNKKQQSEKTASQNTPDSNAQRAFQTEILVEQQNDDDISTLGDPVGFYGGGMVLQDGERDERTASVGDDYDYARQFPRDGPHEKYGLNSVADSNQMSRVSSNQSGYSKVGLGPMAASVFSDDASFEQAFGVGGENGVEEKFEVDVPPGKLGMVIDTPNGGVPVVHAIKSESILFDSVKVGDRLVSVNGEDVTAMTALQVSKLISLKADQHRVLVFIRNRPRADSIER